MMENHRIVSPLPKRPVHTSIGIDENTNKIIDKMCKKYDPATSYCRNSAVMR